MNAFVGGMLRAPAPWAGGSGLGLTIARAIVGAHGGKLGVVDHPQGGAVLTIYLSVTGM
ncbi:ATP-binding protein [uncultured Meiothermus sp.]|uniref:ATP-binding protein n=1 Tax=uncultured Meiothermus sp. TaxID=157471 RepID=UPI002631DD86|nr:ATP-binding protein [uncultured Meiothermus sp.]